MGQYNFFSQIFSWWGTLQFVIVNEATDNLRCVWLGLGCATVTVPRTAYRWAPCSSSSAWPRSSCWCGASRCGPPALGRAERVAQFVEVNEPKHVAATEEEAIQMASSADLSSSVPVTAPMTSPNAM
jgi:hypothetical protein